MRYERTRFCALPDEGRARATPMRTARLLAVLAGVLLVLLFVRTAMAAGADAGTPTLVPTGAGAPSDQWVTGTISTLIASGVS